MRDDATEYALFTYPGAAMTASLATVDERLHREEPEIRLWGNRQGIASMANLFLWTYHNSERDFLPITGLPFVQTNGGISLTLRVEGDTTRPEYGRVNLLDKQCQYEWVIGDQDLKKAGLAVHALASRPCHEYDVFPPLLNGAAVIHFRLTDVMQWL